MVISGSIDVTVEAIPDGLNAVAVVAADGTELSGIISATGHSVASPVGKVRIKNEAAGVARLQVTY
jgi:hypothetical protein